MSCWRENSVPHWLVVRGLSEGCSQHGSWLPVEGRVGERDREPRWKLQRHVQPRLRRLVKYDSIPTASPVHVEGASNPSSRNTLWTNRKLIHVPQPFPVNEAILISLNYDDDGELGKLQI